MFDNRRIGGHSAGDFPWSVFFEKARGQAQQILLHRNTNITHHALAQPADKVKAECRRNADDDDDTQQQIEIWRRVAAIFDKAFIDDQPQAIGNGKRRRRCCNQREQGIGDLAGIADREMPDHAQTAKIKLGLGRDCFGCLGFSHALRFGNIVCHRARLAVRRTGNNPPRRM